MIRDTTISLHDTEKERLDDVRERMFGTDEVPYGVVIDRLCDDHVSNNAETA
ncbi:hypothetical protein [Salarchaeum sp. JOR-1]|uniref:hypothetical protein n=1 Tax=Salarchaeum sp. JOR-1 TaxID=2599399 RepID=UPI00143CE5F4|nr:hypothetical protein [Salarchaeum sp. JOR-1]